MPGLGSGGAPVMIISGRQRTRCGAREDGEAAAEVEERDEDGGEAGDEAEEDGSRKNGAPT